MFKIGDLVTRKKYGNDIIFKIDKIQNNTIYLKGVDVRLYADTKEDDLILATIPKKKEIINTIRTLKTDEYFYIPGTILHLDGDNEYLEKCMDFYKEQKIKCFGYIFKESEFKDNVKKLLTKHNPNILVITGHDAHYQKRKNNESYKNSKYYIETVLEARKYKNNHKDLVIIAGACQSDYEGLIKAQATFASSPKTINIHALDPAIIASTIALTDKTEVIDIEKTLAKTKYGSEGMGGIIINGMMNTGYPRKDIN